MHSVRYLWFTRLQIAERLFGLHCDSSWNKTSSTDRQTLRRTVTQWQSRRNWEVLERRGRPQNTCEELTGMPRTAICVYKIICFLFLSLSLLHSLWFTVHSLHMLPLCRIKYIAVKDSKALWVEHMFSSCSFSQVCQTQMRGAKAKGNLGYKQSPYKGWYYMLRRIFIVNIIFQAHWLTLFYTLPFFWCVVLLLLGHSV